MNYTENYHLPQWDETDRIMRTDFNQMCSDIEAGLNKNVSDAASDSAKASASAAAAQATADTAVAKANAAQKTADAAYCPSFQPYVVGTYTGTGEVQRITTGFRPQYVIITGADSEDAITYFLAAGANVDSVRLEFTSTGFKVNRLVSSSAGMMAPHINYYNKLYAYIAFR